MVKTRNLLVQVFGKTKSGQKLRAIIAWTKNTPMAHPLGLKGLVGRTISRKRIIGNRAK